MSLPNISDQLRKDRFHRCLRFVEICIYVALFYLVTLVPTCHAQPATPAKTQPEQAKASVQTSESPAEIADLIAQLGDADHLVRTQSQAELLKIGPPAIAPLQAVLNFEDSTIALDNEIRLRANRLLILIQREVRKRNLAQFLDGQRNEIDLAGWDEFRNVVGDQGTARRLFVKLHKSVTSLLEAPKLGKLETENVLHKTISRKIRLSKTGNAGSVTGNLGAVLFAASLKTKWDPDKEASTPLVPISDTRKIQSVLVQPHMVTTLKSHFAKAEFRALISTWLQSLPYQSDDSAKYAATAIKVIDAYQLRDKTELLLQFAIEQKLPANVRSQAIKTLSQTGDANSIPKLVPLLDDKTVVGNYLLARPIPKLDKTLETASPQPQSQPLLDVQIRDLALAALIILNGNSPVEFGFCPQAWWENKLVINQAGFCTQQERDKAFSRWEELKSEKQ